MILKSIDLSLMAEHLNVHKGVLSKLKTYFCSAQDTILKQIIYEQYLIMSNHVKVMILLMDNEQNEEITVAFLNEVDPVEIRCQSKSFAMEDGNIALELKNTAKTMAQSNFNSALRMKTHNVRDIHIHMALQQAMLQHRYNDFIKQKMLEKVPETSAEVQSDTLQSFKKMFNLQNDPMY